MRPVRGETRGLVVTEVDEPVRRRVRPEPGETLGVALAVTFLGGFVVIALVIETGHLGDVAVFFLGAALLKTLLAWSAAFLLLALVVAGMRWSSAADRMRVHFKPDAHDPYMHRTIRHEALGHAALADGVGCTGIKARVEEDGSGWVDYKPRKGITPTERLAITRAGEAVAGPEGCSKDRKRAKMWIRQGADESTADALIRQHQGSAFGQKVYRALARNGRFR